MKKITLSIFTLLILTLTACSGASNAIQPDSATSGSLSMETQLIVGTFKLDGTDQAVTAEQATELLPLWQTLQVLYSSDTAAQEEKDALIAQIQETMTPEQTQAITTMNLTQRDVFTIMQERGGGASQRGVTSSNSSGTNNNRNNGGFGPPDDGGFPGGAPPDGGSGFPGGFNQRNQSQSSTQDDTTNTQTRINPATLLLEPLIAFLKQKAGS